MKIKVLPVYKGDSIFVELEDKLNTKILIDTGTKKSYANGFLKKVFEDCQKIDLLVLTHTDEDHIGGMLKYFADTNKKENVFKKIWFNTGLTITKHLGLRSDTIKEIPIHEDSMRKMSVNQSVSLESELKKSNSWLQQTIHADNTFDLNGTKIQILSPEVETLKDFLKVWEIEKSSQTKMAYTTDYHKSVAELKEIVKEELEESGSLANKSSIAFLLTNFNKNILFGGDAFPSVIYNSLKRLGYSSTNKLKLDLFKVSHHCSKYAVSNKLLEMIDCENYIISTNGHSGLPSKESLTRIITHSEKTVFHFNYSNSTIKSIFFENELQDDNFTINYLDQNSYTIQL